MKVVVVEWGGGGGNEGVSGFILNIQSIFIIYLKIGSLHFPTKNP